MTALERRVTLQPDVYASPDAYLARYTKGLAPWLGSLELADKLQAALRRAGFEGCDDEMFAGRSRVAKHARAAFEYVFGISLPARKDQRLGTLKRGPYEFSSAYLAEYESNRPPTPEELAERQRVEAERMAVTAQRSREQDADPEVQARRAATQARLALREALIEALANCGADPDFEYMTVAKALKAPVIVIPKKPTNVLDAGRLRTYGSNGISIGTTSYALRRTDNVKTLPRDVFLRIIAPYREVWTDVMTAIAQETT